MEDLKQDPGNPLDPRNLHLFSFWGPVGPQDPSQEEPVHIFSVYGPRFLKNLDLPPKAT